MMKKLFILFALLVAQISFWSQLYASTGQPAKISGETSIPVVAVTEERDDSTQLVDELNQLMTTLESQYPSRDKKISKELDAIVARIEIRASKAPNIVEKNKILTRLYVSCIIFIEKIGCIERNGFLKFTELKKKIEILKIRLFMQIEPMCKAIEFDATIKKAEEHLTRSKQTNYDVKEASQSISQFLLCHKIADQIENNEAVDFIQRKKELALLQDKIFAHIIELFDFLFFHVNRSIPHLSLEASDFFCKATQTKNAGWYWIKRNIECLALFVGKNEFFIQAAFQGSTQAQNIEKVKLSMETLLLSLDQLFLKLEKKVADCSSENQQTLENWAQITNRIFAQFQMFYDVAALDGLFTAKSKELLKQIKEIKEQIIATIDNNLEFCHSINGTQELNSALSEDKKIALLLKVHGFLMLMAPNNQTAQAKQQKEHISKVICNNWAPLLIEYLKRLRNSDIIGQASQYFFPGHIVNPLWHLLELLCINKSNIKPLSKEEHELVMHHYTKLKRKLMRKILAIQQEIQKRTVNRTLTFQAHEDLISEMHSIYLFMQKLNQQFYEIGLEQNLINMKPILEALAKRPFSLIDQAIKEKNDAEKQVLNGIKELKSDLCESNYHKLVQNIDLLNKEIDFINQIGGGLFLEFKQTALNALGNNFHRIVQKYLMNIYDLNAQAIDKALIHQDGTVIWSKSLDLLEKILHFIQQNPKIYIKCFFANIGMGQLKNKTKELLIQIKNALFLFVVSFEQKIKNDINTNAVFDKEIIPQKINQFRYAIHIYEKLHEVFFELGQYDTKIGLNNRINNLLKALEETSANTIKFEKTIAITQRV